MKIIFFLNFLYLFVLLISCGSNPLKKDIIIEEPEIKLPLTNVTEKGFKPDFSLVGTKNGLYLLNGENPPISVWDKAFIKKILSNPYGIYLLTDRGIYSSTNLQDFTHCKNGLEEKVMKYLNGDQNSISNLPEDLKDLESDPVNQSNLITCSKYKAYYSTNLGRNWIVLNNPGNLSEIRSVAIFSNPDIVVMTGNVFTGIYRKNISKGSSWEKLSEGLKRYGYNYDEVSDILAVSDNGKVDLWCANNFKPALYRFNQLEKKWKVCYQEDGFNLIESIVKKGPDISFLTIGGITSYHEFNRTIKDKKIQYDWIKKLNIDLGAIESICVISNGSMDYYYSQLWLISSNQHQLKNNTLFLI